MRNTFKGVVQITNLINLLYRADMEIKSDVIYLRYIWVEF